ncbi:N-terminal binuclear Zn cluster-containing/DNA binding domain-containing protein [Trichoderma reesei QM6a]|uniref:N-terminal binuclear Zn cluster-containing/DNA binding domain-containing protein n=2 Tax=Hypocrea jecorina TaxID=51453 RepID=G0R992_HYPJQ|nr:N-terminal binuclear Zn cluster-containing/DNA binding domain-containing protein [Trichoderma reesei QM6a]EGR52154.1 N-terminal binuclear Zn cluster-containing/DNA binding domain-containing protein [Trichoderma reesei QM6a]ETS06225.1 Zn(II)2Cys6 cluster transcripitional activator [Trichoderma reesei RUT C-30]
MPRSSFSHTPLLRVSRPVSACSRCRAAKVKCDGKLPACTACEKAGRENACSAANDQFARGKERSYVAALELRIEKLEKRIAYAKSRKASVANHESDSLSTAHVDRRDSLASIRAAIHRKAARTRENSDVNSLISDFGFLSVNATTRDFEPSFINMTFARLVLAAASRDPIPGMPESPLPHKSYATEIFHHFMKNMYPLFPCFSETAALNVLNDIYSQQSERVITASDHWLLYMILAIGSTMQSQHVNDDYYNLGVSFVSRALDYADIALAPGYATQIQSLLLLTQYAILDPNHFDSWLLIGFTARAVIDLGFHQDPPMSTVVDRAALDMRRKIFYCTYALDRSISMVHARTFSFTDDAIHVAFPNPANHDRKGKEAESLPISGPQSVDPGLLLFQLRRAQSYWYQELYQSYATPLQDPSSFVWQMCLDMREWGESLPSSLAPGIRQMFEQELRYSYVYCIAPSARAPEITNYHRTLIFEYSLAYLLTMQDITQSGLNGAYYTYHDALKVYFMANQFLAVLRDSEDMLLSGAHIPKPMSRPGAPQAPPIPPPSFRNGRPGEDNIARSIRCLESVPQTLDVYGRRWEDSIMLKQSFEQLSADTMERLKERRKRQNMKVEHPSYPGSSPVAPSPRVPTATSRSPQQPREIRWVGVDVSQMMQGRGHPQ